MSNPSLLFDRQIFPTDANIVGIDEVGRGSLAGPLVVAGVILPQNLKLPEKFGDSKALKEPYRTEVCKFLKQNATEFVIVRIENVILDTVGMTKSLQYAYQKVISRFSSPISGIILDGRPIETKINIEQKAVIKGDTLSASVAAASIIAKVYRDMLMKNLSLTYPGYGFEQHFGYGTQLHRDKILELGPCALHRLSFIKRIDAFT